MSRIRRILAIDGGGVRGAVPASFLANLEAKCNARVVDRFDLIAGTSTGGIIALGLAMGMSASEIVEFYRLLAPKVFGRAKARRLFSAKYSSEPLRAELARVFGDRLLGEAATRLLIPAYDSKRQQLHVFKTAHHPRLQTDCSERVVDVALATAAAPSYFPTHSIAFGPTLADGGLWANNPAGAAAVEAMSLLGWQGDEVRVLSLGCGGSPFEIPDDAGIINVSIRWICGRMSTPMIDMLFKGQSNAAIGAARLLTMHTKDSKRVWRIEPDKEHGGEVALDGHARIEDLIRGGAALAAQNLDEIASVFMHDEREAFVPCHMPNLSGIDRSNRVPA